MNQVAVQNTPKPALTVGGPVAAIVPQSIEEAFRLSDAIHQAQMSPYGLDTPQKVMIAMMQGMELGLPPMMSVQSIAVINNRPCMWGDALIGVVRKSPQCVYIKEWIDGEGDSRIAYCETQRKGEPEPVRRSFSVNDAQRAGLWETQARVTKKGRNGGTYEKDNDSPWWKYPQRMLQMRARAWCLRDVYADVLKGMQVREEVEDTPQMRDVTPDPEPESPSQGNALLERLGGKPQEQADGFEAAQATIDQEIADAVEPEATEDQPDQSFGADAGQTSAPAEDAPGDDGLPSEDAPGAPDPEPNAADEYIDQLRSMGDAEAVKGLTADFMNDILKLPKADQDRAEDARKGRLKEIAEASING